MVARNKTYSIDDERDADVIEWLYAQRNYSHTIVAALREKMEREAGEEQPAELLKKIWGKLQNMNVISSGIEETEENLEHLSAALAALDLLD